MDLPASQVLDCQKTAQDFVFIQGTVGTARRRWDLAQFCMGRVVVAAGCSLVATCGDSPTGEYVVLRSSSCCFTLLTLGLCLSQPCQSLGHAASSWG